MLFEQMPVPGARWVEIVTITNKDGSPIGEYNWRRSLFGRITLCWIAGGLCERCAFFKAEIRMVGGKVVMVDLHDNSWCSRTTAQPIEVEPGVFDFETNTSIYRFRLLTDEEEKKVSEAVKIVLDREIGLFEHGYQTAYGQAFAKLRRDES